MELYIIRIGILIRFIRKFEIVKLVRIMLFVVCKDELDLMSRIILLFIVSMNIMNIRIGIVKLGKLYLVVFEFGVGVEL